MIWKFKWLWCGLSSDASAIRGRVSVGGWGWGSGRPLDTLPGSSDFIPKAVVRGTFSTGHDMFKYKLWEMLLYLGQMDWEAVGRARRDSRAGDFRNSRREDNDPEPGAGTGQEGHYCCESEETNHLLYALWPSGRLLNCVKIVKINPGVLNSAFPASWGELLILLLGVHFIFT